MYEVQLFLGRNNVAAASLRWISTVVQRRQVPQYLQQETHEKAQVYLQPRFQGNRAIKEGIQQLTLKGSQNQSNSGRKLQRRSGL